MRNLGGEEGKTRMEKHGVMCEKNLEKNHPKTITMSMMMMLLRWYFTYNYYYHYYNY